MRVIIFSGIPQARSASVAERSVEIAAVRCFLKWARQSVLPSRSRVYSGGMSEQCLVMTVTGTPARFAAILPVKEEWVWTISGLSFLNSAVSSFRQRGAKDLSNPGISSVRIPAEENSFFVSAPSGRTTEASKISPFKHERR